MRKSAKTLESVSAFIDWQKLKENYLMAYTIDHEQRELRRRLTEKSARSAKSQKSQYSGSAANKLMKKVKKKKISPKQRTSNTHHAIHHSEDMTTHYESGIIKTIYGDSKVDGINCTDVELVAEFYDMEQHEDDIMQSQRRTKSSKTNYVAEYILKNREEGKGSLLPKSKGLSVSKGKGSKGSKSMQKTQNGKGYKSNKYSKSSKSAKGESTSKKKKKIKVSKSAKDSSRFETKIVNVCEEVNTDAPTPDTSFAPSISHAPSTSTSPSASPSISFAPTRFTSSPSSVPSVSSIPSLLPSAQPSSNPSVSASNNPTGVTPQPTKTASEMPSNKPSKDFTISPAPSISFEPTREDIYRYNEGDCSEEKEGLQCSDPDLRKICNRYHPLGSFKECYRLCKPSFCCIYDTNNEFAESCSDDVNCAQYAYCYIVWFHFHSTFGPATYIKLEQHTEGQQADTFFDLPSSVVTDRNNEDYDFNFVKELYFHHFEGEGEGSQSFETAKQKYDQLGGDATRNFVQLMSDPQLWQGGYPGSAEEEARK